MHLNVHVVCTESDEGKLVDSELLGGVFGGVVSLLALVSLTVIGLIWYMSRPVQHAV